MHISGEGKIGIALGLLGLSGVGVPMVAPQYPWLGWLFIATSGLGLLALAFHHFFGPETAMPLAAPRKREPSLYPGLDHGPAATAVAGSNPSGKWIGSRFVCDTPFHVFSALVTAQDNDRIQIFEVPYAPIDSLVEIIVEIDRHDERVKAAVVWPKAPGQSFLPWHTRQTRTSLKLPGDRLLALKTLAATEADVTTIRVRIAGWTMGRSA